MKIVFKIYLIHGMHFFRHNSLVIFISLEWQFCHWTHSFIQSTNINRNTHINSSELVIFFYQVKFTTFIISSSNFAMLLIFGNNLWKLKSRINTQNSHATFYIHLLRCKRHINEGTNENQKKRWFISVEYFVHRSKWLGFCTETECYIFNVNFHICQRRTLLERVPAKVTHGLLLQTHDTNVFNRSLHD